MKKLLISITLLSTVFACSSNKTFNVPVSSTDPDYVVRERNIDPSPNWYRDFTQWKIENDGKGQHYFMGESGEVSERIGGCELAALNAKRKIADQIAELITGKILASEKGKLVLDPSNPGSDGLSHEFENALASKSMAILSGVQEYSVFWEHRDYSKTQGSKRVYLCAVMVRIAERDYKLALEKSSQKAPEVAKDSESRSIIKDVLKQLNF